MSLVVTAAHLGYCFDCSMVVLSVFTKSPLLLCYFSSVIKGQRPREASAYCAVPVYFAAKKH